MGPDPAGNLEPAPILYMDEIFGYFPPTANPPSKTPMLTLLKQARAYGLGIMLATQNPVDLDYKGLSNAGTWFLGRLQTKRDKEPQFWQDWKEPPAWLVKSSTGPRWTPCSPAWATAFSCGIASTQISLWSSRRGGRFLSCAGP